MTPQAVVFDLGKVLLEFDYAIAAEKIASQSGKTPSEIFNFLLHTPLLLSYETGLMSSQAFYKGLSAGIGYSGTFDDLAASFGNIFSPIAPMIQLHGALADRGVPTYVFSNTNELAIKYIRTAYPFFARFTGHILSYEHGCMKPDPRIYEILEQQSRLRGAALLYIDDRPENVEAGARRGWQTILHRTTEQTIGIVDLLLGVGTGLRPVARPPA